LVLVIGSVRYVFLSSATEYARRAERDKRGIAGEKAENVFGNLVLV